MKKNECDKLIDKYALEILECQNEMKAGFIVMKIIQETESSIKNKIDMLYKEL